MHNSIPKPSPTPVFKRISKFFSSSSNSKTEFKSSFTSFGPNHHQAIHYFLFLFTAAANPFSLLAQPRPTRASPSSFGTQAAAINVSSGARRHTPRTLRPPPLCKTKDLHPVSPETSTAALSPPPPSETEGLRAHKPPPAIPSSGNVSLPLP
jgi:hypothetical protein